MNWLNALDVYLFHWVNPALANPVFDVLMPFFSGNAFFAPVLIALLVFVVWKGGARARVCAVMVVLAVALGDSFVCNTLKHVILRPRPFTVLSDIHVPAAAGLSDSPSMPSSHAANWFAATMVLFIYYRKSWRFMLPLAVTVAFSRIYNGVHYPGDVAAGAVLGAGYAAGGVWALDALWRRVGRRWFPVWWRRLPSLLDPTPAPFQPLTAASEQSATSGHWLRLGYLLIFILLAVNIGYLASGRLELSEDEAYQWIWSKHPALSYYSKPLLIAVTQWLGTHLWGDTAFGVRFFSPVIGAVLSLVLLRFVARVLDARAAFWLTVVILTTPLLAVGSVLMTVDPLSVLFWTLAMIAGWRAVRDDATTADWLWVGFWTGLGLLSKYSALYQLISWAVFFALWPPARKQLSRPGPWLALLVVILCSTPVLIWNAQRGWVTIRHVSEGGHFNEKWAFTPANLWLGFRRFTTDYVGSEAALLNPLFFIPAVWAAVRFWRNGRRQPLALYFFSMGAPIFLLHLLLSFRSRVLPNWIAPGILPLFCLGAVYWNGRWREGFRGVQDWLKAGITLGVIAVVLMHNTKLVSKISGHSLPPNLDPARRVEAWAETARAVDAVRQKMLQEGKPVFIIGGHYGIVGEVSFYLPEAKAGIPDHPLVYYVTTSKPDNQFYFWPGYHDRKGQNAIYIQKLGLAETDHEPIPPILYKEFESVTELPPISVIFDGKVMRRVQICECRTLR